MTTIQEKSCRDTCNFIIHIYIERWFRYQNILFLRCLIEYEKVDKQISKSFKKNVMATYGA